MNGFESRNILAPSTAAFASASSVPSVEASPPEPLASITGLRTRTMADSTLRNLSGGRKFLLSVTLLSLFLLNVLSLTSSLSQERGEKTIPEDPVRTSNHNNNDNNDNNDDDVDRVINNNKETSIVFDVYRKKNKAMQKEEPMLFEREGEIKSFPDIDSFLPSDHLESREEGLTTTTTTATTTTTTPTTSRLRRKRSQMVEGVQRKWMRRVVQMRSDSSISITSSSSSPSSHSSPCVVGATSSQRTFHFDAEKLVTKINASSSPPSSSTISSSSTPYSTLVHTFVISDCASMKPASRRQSFPVKDFISELTKDSVFPLKSTICFFDSDSCCNLALWSALESDRESSGDLILGGIQKVCASQKPTQSPFEMKNPFESNNPFGASNPIYPDTSKFSADPELDSNIVNNDFSSSSSDTTSALTSSDTATSRPFSRNGQPSSSSSSSSPSIKGVPIGKRLPVADASSSSNRLALPLPRRNRLQRLRRSLDLPTFEMSTLKYVFKEDGDALRIVDDTLRLLLTPEQQQQLQQQKQPVDFVTAKLVNRPNGNSEVLTVDVVKKKYNVSINGIKREVEIPYPDVSFKNGTLKISGVSTTRDFELVLKSLKYENRAEEPFAQKRTIQILAYPRDFPRPGTPLTLSVDVLPVNDSPYFKDVRPLTRVIMEDTSANQLDPMNVEELFGSLIADRDAGSEKGIAILGADNRHGQWEYLTYPQPWTPLDVVYPYIDVDVTEIPRNVSLSIPSVVLRSKWDNFLRFLPAKDFSGETFITVVCWDLTAGTETLNDGDIVNATYTGKSSPFSEKAVTMKIIVQETNDPPVIVSSPLDLPSIKEDDDRNSGISLDLITKNIQDPENDAVGIAITGVTSSSSSSSSSGVVGFWQFKAQGFSWRNFGAISPSSALLLGVKDEAESDVVNDADNEIQIRFLPAPNFHGVVAFKYRAWDVTRFGATGSYVDVSSSSGSGADKDSGNPASSGAAAINGAFSESEGEIRLLVENLNDSPFIVGGKLELDPVDEDVEDAINVGTSVEDMLENRFKDVDGNAQPGVAVVGVDERFGVWQFRCDEEREDDDDDDDEESDEKQSTWRRFVGSECDLKSGVSVGIERATLLSSSCFIRFVPKRDFNFKSENGGEFNFPSLEVLGWDGSNDDHNNNNNNNNNNPISRIGMDVSHYNQSRQNPFSSSSYKISILVNPVNDPTVLRVGDGSVDGQIEYSERQSPIAVVSEQNSQLFDIDSPTIEWVSIEMRLDGVEQSRRNATCEEDKVLFVNAGNSVKLVHKGTCPKQFMIMPKDLIGVGNDDDNNNDKNNSATFLRAVRAMHFFNDASEPIPGDRVILFRAFDGRVESPVAKVVVKMKMLNDRPKLLANGKIADILEDISEEENIGTRISDILTGIYQDKDEESFPGLAVVGVDNSHGVWQKSCCGRRDCRNAKNPDPGTLAWTNFIGDEIFGMFAPALPTSRRATLLGAGCRVRFVPAKDFNTENCRKEPTCLIPAMHVKAWDGSTGTSVLEGRYGQDTEKSINSKDANQSPFGFETMNVTVQVTPANDPPITECQPLVKINPAEEEAADGYRRKSNCQVSYTENSGQNLLLRSNILTVSDIDDDFIEYIDVSLENAQDKDEELLRLLSTGEGLEDVIVNFTLVSPLDDNMAGKRVYRLTLRSNDSSWTHKSISTKMPTRMYEQIVQTLVYINVAEEPMPSPRLVTITAFDGKNLSTPANIFISMQLVGDNSPTLHVISKGTEFVEGQIPISILARPKIFDQDNPLLFNMNSATIQIKSNLANCDYETFKLDRSSANCSYLNNLKPQISWSADECLFNISGSFSIRIYEDLMRCVKYMNLAEEPQPGKRDVEIRVTDSQGFQSNVETIYIDVLQINDNPPLIHNSQSIIFVENSNGSFIGDRIQILDLDKGEAPLDRFSIRLSPCSKDSAERIRITRPLSPKLTVVYATSGCSIDIKGEASLKQYQDLLSSVIYFNEAEELENATKTFQISLGDSVFSADGSVNVEIRSRNDPPVMETAKPFGIIEYTEGEESVSLIPSDFHISDSDSGILSMVKIEIINGQNGDILYFESPNSRNKRSASSSFTSSSCPSTGLTRREIVVKENQTPLEWTRLLKSLRFCSRSQNAESAQKRTVSVKLFDADNAFGEYRVKVAVAQKNDAPELRDSDTQIILEGTEDQSLDLELLQFVVDPDHKNADINFTVVDDPHHGKMLKGSQNLTYIPDHNYHGFDQLEVQACDIENACSKPFTVQIMLRPVNDPPVVKQPVHYNLQEDDEVIIDLKQVMIDAEDSDVDGYPFIKSVTQPTRGKLRLKSHNILVYEPEADFSGSDSFNFSACDTDNLCSDPARVTLTILPVNDPPAVDIQGEGNPAFLTTKEDQKIDVKIIIFDIESNVPASINWTTTKNSSFMLKESSIKERAGDRIMEEKIFSFTPPSDFSGREYVNMTVCDAENSCTPASFYVEVTPENDAPRVRQPVVHILEDSTLLCPLLTCFDVIDPDSNIVNEDATLTAKKEMNPRRWNVTNGVFSYAPPKDYFTETQSDSDIFTLKVCDGQICTTKDVSVFVQPVNDAPIAKIGHLVIEEDGSGQTDLTQWLSDVEDGVVVSHNVKMLKRETDKLRVAYDSATGTLHARGKPNAWGEDEIPYRACDSRNACVEGVVQVEILGVNDPPFARNLTWIVGRNIADIIPVHYQYGDPDLDGDDKNKRLSLVVSRGRGGSGDGSVGSSDASDLNAAVEMTSKRGAEVVAIPGHGSVMYRPPKDFIGRDSFDYIICDECVSGSQQTDEMCQRQASIARRATTRINNDDNNNNNNNKLFSAPIPNCATATVLVEVTEPDEAAEKRSQLVADMQKYGVDRFIANNNNNINNEDDLNNEHFLNNGRFPLVRTSNDFSVTTDWWILLLICLGVAILVSIVFLGACYFRRHHQKRRRHQHHHRRDEDDDEDAAAHHHRHSRTLHHNRHHHHIHQPHVTATPGRGHPEVPFTDFDRHLALSPGLVDATNPLVCFTDVHSLGRASGASSSSKYNAAIPDVVSYSCSNCSNCSNCSSDGGRSPADGDHDEKECHSESPFFERKLATEDASSSNAQAQRKISQPSRNCGSSCSSGVGSSCSSSNASTDSQKLLSSGEKTLSSSGCSSPPPPPPKSKEYSSPNSPPQTASQPPSSSTSSSLRLPLPPPPLSYTPAAPPYNQYRKTSRQYLPTSPAAPPAYHAAISGSSNGADNSSAASSSSSPPPPPPKTTSKTAKKEKRAIGQSPEVGVSKDDVNGVINDVINDVDDIDVVVDVQLPLTSIGPQANRSSRHLSSVLPPSSSANSPYQALSHPLLPGQQQQLTSSSTFPSNTNGGDGSGVLHRNPSSSGSGRHRQPPPPPRPRSARLSSIDPPSQEESKRRSVVEGKVVGGGGGARIFTTNVPYRDDVVITTAQTKV